MAITQEKNIEMLEKLPDGNFKIKYPKTRDTQVIGLETAQKILDKIKTVDGSGSGLDADLLDGKQANEILLGLPRNFGSVTYTDVLAAMGSLTKNISIGSGYTKAKLCIYANFNSTADGEKTLTAIIESGVSNNDNFIICVGAIDSRQTYKLRRTKYRASKVIKDSLNSARDAVFDSNGIAGLSECFINGSSLKLVFKSDINAATNLNCTIDWEVW